MLLNLTRSCSTDMKDTGTKDLAEALLEDSALGNGIFPIVLGELALLVVHCWQLEEEHIQGRPSEDSRGAAHGKGIPGRGCSKDSGSEARAGRN